MAIRTGSRPYARMYDGHTRGCSIRVIRVRTVSGMPSGMRHLIACALSTMRVELEARTAVALTSMLFYEYSYSVYFSFFWGAGFEQQRGFSGQGRPSEKMLREGTFSPPRIVDSELSDTTRMLRCGVILIDISEQLHLERCCFSKV